MKHFSGYLLQKYGTVNIFDLDISDEEYYQLLGWTKALEEYETDKQIKSLTEVLSRITKGE